MRRSSWGEKGEGAAGWEAAAGVEGVELAVEVGRHIPYRTHSWRVSTGIIDATKWGNFTTVGAQAAVTGRFKWGRRQAASFRPSGQLPAPPPQCLKEGVASIRELTTLRISTARDTHTNMHPPA